jgi:hypothetical protein
MQTPRTILLPGLVLALGVLTMPLSGCGGDAPPVDQPVPVYNADPNNPRMKITLDNEAEYIKKGELRPASKK